MKRKHLIKNILLAATLLLGGANSAWADDVPTPVYFNDFSTTTGLTQKGSGDFVNSLDGRFGKYYQNDPDVKKEIRTNYLQLPANVFNSFSESSDGITVGFWVNAKKAIGTVFYWSPLFAAYQSEPVAGTLANGESGLIIPTDKQWDGFQLFARSWARYNLYTGGGYCDFTGEQNDVVRTNDKGERINNETSAWLDDGNWHYYSFTMTNATTGVKACVYVDGNIVNSWTINADNSAFFSNIKNYTYVCLGGVQYNNYADIDPAFAYDDFAVYDVALTKAQIDQIRKNKLVQGTQVGELDYTSDFLGASTTEITLNPGDSYHYRFINYNSNSTDNNANGLNYLIPVYNPSSERVIILRADNWELMHHHGDSWGSNAGCTSNFNWTGYVEKMNGATVDMTVSFTKDKVFTMSSTITTLDGTVWNYSYSNDYKYKVNEVEYDSPIDLTSYSFIKVALSVNYSWLDLLSEGYSGVAATMGANGYATFGSPYALDLANLPAGLTAYKGKVSGTNVNFSSVDVAVPAHTGLLLKGDNDETYTIPVAESASALADNDLEVNATGNTFPGDTDFTYYGMLKPTSSSDALTFGVFNPSTVAIPANKAYLKVANTSARELTVTFGEEGSESETTGINAVSSEKANNDYYNLAGQRVAAPTKGLYIVNGKKYVVK